MLDIASFATLKDKFITKEVLIRVVVDNYPSLFGKPSFGCRVFKGWVESSRTFKGSKANQPGI
jgi:hypothetical protein